MTRESLAGSLFRETFAVHRGGVEVVDSMLQSVVHQFVDGFLVDVVLVLGIGARDGRPAHATVAQETDLLTMYTGAVFHPALFILEDLSCFCGSVLYTRREAGDGSSCSECADELTAADCIVRFVHIKSSCVVRDLLHK